MPLTRAATPEDADAMSAVLSEILQDWGSTRPGDATHVRRHYIDHPNSIACTVALDDQGQVIGFQSLQIAGTDNPYDLPADWGMIGTYVALSGGRKGTGRALFAASKAAAMSAGLTHVDATIGKDNETGLAYYEAMGFRSYRDTPTAICKMLTL